MLELSEEMENEIKNYEEELKQAKQSQQNLTKQLQNSVQQYEIEHAAKQALEGTLK